MLYLVIPKFFDLRSSIKVPKSNKISLDSKAILGCNIVDSIIKQMIFRHGCYIIKAKYKILVKMETFGIYKNHYYIVVNLGIVKFKSINKSIYKYLVDSEKDELYLVINSSGIPQGILIEKNY